MNTDRDKLKSAVPALCAGSSYQLTSTAPPYMYRVLPHTVIMGLTRARGLSSLLLMSTPCRVAGEYSSSLSLPPSWYVLMACSNRMICQMANNQVDGGPWRGNCHLLVVIAFSPGHKHALLDV